MAYPLDTQHNNKLHATWLQIRSRNCQILWMKDQQGSSVQSALQVRHLARAKYCIFSNNAHIGSWTQRDYISTGIGPQRPGREAHHSPPSSAEDMNV